MDVEQVLQALNRSGDYPLSLVCTDEGLLIASAGSGMDSDQLAGLTSLFDDIVTRAHRDLEMGRVDEVTLLGAGHGRLVVRPLVLHGALRFFLVLQADPGATWRRNTNRACVALRAPLGGLVGAL